MITFIICLCLLVAAYFIYGRFLERVCEADKITEVPSKSRFDGVDYVPLPRWKTFLIQLLNIAGLGPIFGAVLGATYGPVAFLWITLGGIFFGAMHDYFSAMMSIENNGASLPEIIGKYLGLSVKQFMRIFTVLLMILVGAVFMLGPAELLADMTGWSADVWIWIVFAYYFIATLLPIDKIIGRVYPFFGAALLFMVVGLFVVLMSGSYTIPELTSLTNMKSNASQFPIIPTLCITIACGAISGFHATQSPLMARCVRTSREGRSVFFGAMISESIIALVWAAIAMAFFGGVDGLNSSLAEHGDNAAWVVNEITATTMGKVGAILAILGVVVAPITSGDTAFRSARLIVADFMHIEQSSLLKRLYICLPLFAIGYAISLMNYAVVWRYFAWANQTLAVFTLWAITLYLHRKGKNVIISLVPAVFMTFICADFLLVSRQMLGLNTVLGAVIAGVFTICLLVYFLLKLRRDGKTGA